MKKVLCCVVFLLLSFFSIFSQGVLSTEQKQAVAMMNYVQYVTYKLKSYNNIVLLKDEYRTLKNMNLEVIKDEESVREINNLMNNITEEVINNMTLERLERSIQRRMNNAIFQNTTNVTAVFYGSVDPFSLVLNAVRAAGNMYMSVQQTKNQLSEEFDEKSWEIEQRTMRSLNQIYEKLNLYSFRLIKDYSLLDEWRVTEEQIQPIFDRLKDPDLERRYLTLKDLSDKPYYDHFPLYWYYLGIAAADCGYDDLALKYYNKFEDENVGIFRIDYTALDAYKGKIAILVKNVNLNKKEILEKLSYIEKNTNDNDEDAWKNYYYCALVYSRLGNKEKAENLLKKNIRTLSQKVELQLMDGEYLTKLLSKDDHTDFNFGFDGCDGLELSRELLSNLNRTVAVNSIIEQYKNDSASYNEYIYMFGLTSSEDVIKNSLNDISKISTGITYSSVKDVRINVLIPLQWVMNMNTEIQAVFVGINNDEIVIPLEINEKKTKKTLKRDDKKLEYEIKYKMPDGYQFSGIRISHPKYPLTLFYDLVYGKKNKDCKIQYIDFNGKKYRIDGDSIFKIEESMLESNSESVSIENKGYNSFINFFIKIGQFFKNIFSSIASFFKGLFL